MIIYIYIPLKINFLVFKNNFNMYLLIYTHSLYFYTKIRYVGYYKNSNFLKIYSNTGEYSTNILFNYIICNLNFYLKKINFKGKGYKILKKNNTLILNFNYSHINITLFFNTICIKLNKFKYIFVHKNLIKITNLILKIIKIRYLNIYTKRGVRLSKTIIYRKIGKRV